MIERILWSLYDYAEIYTFLLVWVAVPLGFLLGFLYLRRVSEPVLNMPNASSNGDAVVRSESLESVQQPPKEQKVNVNEANA